MVSTQSAMQRWAIESSTIYMVVNVLLYCSKSKVNHTVCVIGQKQNSNTAALYAYLEEMREGEQMEAEGKVR